jgi:superfamily II DNA or RNA helicase
MTTTQDEYRAFLARKKAIAAGSGFAVAPEAIHPRAFPHQQAVTPWAIERGSAALLMDTGLGKTFCQLEWGRHIRRQSNGQVLVFAPLAVAHQTVKEARHLDLSVAYVRSQQEANERKADLYISNYDMVKAFDYKQWSGIVLDESDILNNYTGATRRKLQSTFHHCPYRLACSATPAANDLVELGCQSEFLGAMKSHDMLTRFFFRDSNRANQLTLRVHATLPFYDWVASWAVCLTRPSDLGFDDAGYDLPPLDVQHHVVDVDHTRAWAHAGRDGQRQMFLDTKRSATGIWKEKTATLAPRCDLAAELAATAPDDPWIIWVQTDEESREVAKRIPGAVEVRGSEAPEVKERKLAAFSDSEIRVLVTKPSIAGMGLNWQHCARMIFVSLTFSFKQFYQALRRIYRFGQRRPVLAHVITAETEESILGTMRAKQESHSEMQRQIIAAMHRTGLMGTIIRPDGMQAHERPLLLPSWLQSAA